MATPVNKYGVLRGLLQQYLEQETQVFEPDTTWDYYSQEHSPDIAPKGAIFIDRIKETDAPTTFDVISKVVKIHLRLTVSRHETTELIDDLNSWYGLLRDEIIFKLKCDGYQNYFKGIYFDPAVDSTFQVNKNQDNGGTGHLHLFLCWHDHNFLSGNTIGQLL